MYYKSYRMFRINTAFIYSWLVNPCVSFIYPRNTGLHCSYRNDIPASHCSTISGGALMTNDSNTPTSTTLDTFQ